jgi:hypothetical protein
MKRFWLNFPYGTQIREEAVILHLSEPFLSVLRETVIKLAQTDATSSTLSVSQNQHIPGFSLRFVELPDEEAYEELYQRYEENLTDGKPHVIGMHNAVDAIFPDNEEPTTTIYAIEVTRTGITLRGYSGGDGQYECETGEVSFAKIGITIPTSETTEYDREDYLKIATMLQRPGGGSFDYSLGEALRKSDQVQAHKLRKGFESEFATLLSQWTAQIGY